MRMAVIPAGGEIVVNVIEANKDFKIEGYFLVETKEAGPGWTYSGGQFTPPPPAPDPTPPEISSWRARTIMKFHDLDDKIMEIIAKIPDDKERIIAEMAYTAGSSFERKSVLVNTILTALGKTPDEIDDYFRQAAALPS